MIKIYQVGFLLLGYSFATLHTCLIADVAFGRVSASEIGRRWAPNGFTEKYVRLNKIQLKRRVCVFSQRGGLQYDITRYAFELRGECHCEVLMVKID